MKLAESVGIQAPLHGLVRCADETFCYFIKRMDRTGHKDKIPLEDFAQLSGKSRDTKYDSSVEQIIVVIQKYCTFPALEAKHFFHRFVFNFLIGNEDMHLKNYSLITLDGVIKLAPAYDFLNTTIALANPKEETALPLNGKKRNLTAKDILSHLPFGRLSLTPKTVDDVLGQIRKSLPTWNDWIEASFLSVDLKEKYKAVVQERKSRLGF